jgi:flagellar hook-length control protein FliK
MMSDIAKQMYENYKPPVTVFRINLNPLHLGSIAIMMKNDKDNALSISMSVSNNSTLDAMVDNQNVLRNSLNKTFEDTTKFNLDFNSNEQNNNQSSNNNQSGNRKFEDNIATQSILESREDNLEVEDRNTDYM